MFWVVIALCVLADQLTKAAANAYIQPAGNIPILPGILDFTYARNTGAAFSILTGRQSLLIAVTAVLMAGMCIYVLRQGKALFSAEKYAIALIVGGGLGNLICRIFRGYVVDFINIHIIPIFNVADMCVVCGCALLVLSIMWLEPKKTGVSFFESGKK